jgi:hypothetical protein
MLVTSYQLTWHCIPKDSIAVSSAPVPIGNTFQDLLQLRETKDNTESYRSRDIHVTYINTVKFN